MVQKKKVHEGPQTLKQAKAAFKARGSTAVSSAEKRQLERGAILLARADRIKEQEQRRKELREKKADVKCPVPPRLGTQRRLDRFGYKSSQFHLGAFFAKPKGAAPLSPQTESCNLVQDETCSLEPWEDDHVDDDTLLDLANESPVLTNKSPAKLSLQMTPTKAESHRPAENTRPIIPLTIDEDLSHWGDFLEGSSQLARDLGPAQDTTASPSFDRIPSFSSVDFDFSMDDLEELDLPVTAVARQDTDPDPFAPTHASLKAASACDSSKSNMQQTCEHDQPPKPKDIDRALMPPPPPPPLKPRAKQGMPMQKEAPAHVDLSTSYMPHGISLADLENLAGEDIQLSQFDGT